MRGPGRRKAQSNLAAAAAVYVRKVGITRRFRCRGKGIFPPKVQGSAEEESASGHEDIVKCPVKCEQFSSSHRT